MRIKELDKNRAVFLLVNALIYGMLFQLLYVFVFIKFKNFQLSEPENPWIPAETILPIIFDPIATKGMLLVCGIMGTYGLKLYKKNLYAAIFGFIIIMAINLWHNM